MTTLLLLSLRLLNFKGARDVTLACDGLHTDVFADNGVGKTTLADAWSWLLFGKDSRNQADFEVKTLDADGNAIPAIDHAVEARFKIGGRVRTLRRVYKETYTKKRGQVKAEFTGHTTDYYVDDVPAQKKEFDAVVSALCAEKTFRLLSDPFLFNDDKACPPQERRRMLLDLCGDVSDADVIAARNALAALPEILRGRSVDDHKKVIVARRKAINSEMEGIPLRIDEANRQLPAARAEAFDLEALRSELSGLQGTREQIKAGGGAIEKENEALRLVGQQNALVVSLTSAGGAAREQALASVDRKDAELSDAQARKRSLEARVRQAEAERATVEGQREEFRKLCWAEEEKRKKRDAEAFQANAAACATCGQPLSSEEQIASARSKFNADKAADLEAIKVRFEAHKADGIARKNRSETIDREIEGIRAQIATVDADIARLLQERAAIVVPEGTIVDPTQDPEYRRLDGEIAALREEIAAIQADATSALSGIDEEIDALQGQIARAERAEADARQREQIQARIETLKGEEKRLAVEFEDLERQLFLCDEFVRAKVAMLTDRINRHFAFARFRLFENQINGGLSECCEVMAAGDGEDAPLVPFNSLNTGNRINVGLDVIDALSAHHGFAPPIFVDGAESVTRLLPTRGQQIRLVVSEGDKALRVVTHGSPVAAEPQKETLFA